MLDVTSVRSTTKAAVSAKTLIPRRPFSGSPKVRGRPKTGPDEKSKETLIVAGSVM
jgi:hypothetical protein